MATSRPLAPPRPCPASRQDRVGVVLHDAEGEYYATSIMCTHGQASLAEGYLDGYEIERPLHQGLFDIRTGEAVGAPCTEAIRTYPVKLNGAVFSK